MKQKVLLKNLAQKRYKNYIDYLTKIRPLINYTKGCVVINMPPTNKKPITLVMINIQ